MDNTKSAKDNRLIMIGNYPPPYGGISVHVKTLVNKLEAEALYKLEILSVDIGGVADPWERKTVRYFSTRISFFRGLVTHIKNAGCVHLHTNGHNFKSWVLVGLTALITHTFQSRSVLTLHSGSCEDYLRNLHVYQKRSVRFFLDLFTHVIVVNDPLKACLEKEIKTHSAVLVVPAYLGLSEKPGTVTDDRIKGFIARSDKLFCSIVAYRPEYGVDTLLSFFKDYSKDHPDSGMIIVGSGEGRGELQDLLVRSGHEHNILLLWDLPACQIYAVLGECDVFIRATRFDGDAVSVREAIELGIPVVASKTSFRPETVVTFGIDDPVDLRRKIDVLFQAGSNGKPVISAVSPGERNFSLIKDVYRDCWKNMES